MATDDSGITYGSTTTTYTLYDRSQETFDSAGNLVVPPSAVVNQVSTTEPSVTFDGAQSDFDPATGRPNPYPTNPTDLLTSIENGVATAGGALKDAAKKAATTALDVTAILSLVTLGLVVGTLYLFRKELTEVAKAAVGKK